MKTVSQISNTYKNENEKDKPLQDIEDQLKNKLTGTFSTVDCKDWNFKVDLLSHPLGTPQIKPDNEKFQGVSIVFDKKLLKIVAKRKIL